MSTVEVAPLTRRMVDEPCGPVTEREWRARTLEAAALEIEMRGWCRDEYRNANGAVCLRGAIGIAEGGAPEDEWAWSIWDTPGRNDYVGLAFWNDDHCRSAAEATFVLRWRAQEIRDGR